MSLLDDTPKDRHGIGGNNPPTDAEIFADKMRGIYDHTLSHAEKLIAAEDRIPEVINDDEMAGKVSDFIKQVKSCDKALDAAREGEKAPFLAASRMVDGFFNKFRDDLKKLSKKAADPLAAYQKKKEDEARREREEAAERKRLEAEATLREAERKRKEAEEKERLAREENERIQREAAARQKAIEDAAAAEKKRQEDEIARLKAEKDAQDKADKEKQAELKRQLEEANEKLKQVKAEEKAALKEVKAETEAAEDAVHEIAKQAKADNREANKLLDTAVRTDRQADKLDKLAGQSAAELARVRGSEGSIATVRTEWVATLTERDKLDLEALRQHISEDALQIAINSWAKANNGKHLRGAYCREENTAVVR